MDNRRPCPWCNASPDGVLRQVGCADSKNPGRVVIVQFYGGSTTIKLKMGKDAEQEQIMIPINYCPFCGAKQRSELLALW